MPEPVLCFVRDQWAYFTTQPLADQHGDDWNDVPYEHNAEEPDEPRDGNTWRIIKVAWDGPYRTPRDGHVNSPWSVEQINAGAVAWLIPDYAPDGARPIPAGVTLDEFRERMHEAGGTVYVEQPWGPDDRMRVLFREYALAELDPEDTP